MLSRRAFLKDGAFALVSLGFAPSFLARTAYAQGRSGRQKQLIAIFQRGAVDGLSVIVPFGEAEYYRARPSIAVGRPGSGSDTAVDLDGFFGLNPRLAPLKPFWDERALAIVHACGSPDSTRSHFDAQDYMESATPGVKSTGDGWLNRCLQVSTGARNPLRGVALARTMPRSLQGVAPALAFGSLDEFDVPGRAGTNFEDEYERSSDVRLGAAAGDAFAAMRTLRQAARTPYRPAQGVTYPPTPFGRALLEIARLAKADVGLEVAFTELGNWDHHVNEGAATGQIATRLSEFSNGLAALAADLADRLADTLIVTMSEFGRAVAENGNGGTDHGHGNAMMIIGGGVRGGVHGTWPGLAPEQRFEGRDLAVTTDFRDVFGEIVVGHLGVPRESLATIFPGHVATSTPGVLRA